MNTDIIRGYPDYKNSKYYTNYCLESYKKVYKILMQNNEFMKKFESLFNGLNYKTNRSITVFGQTFDKCMKDLFIEYVDIYKNEYNSNNCDIFKCSKKINEHLIVII